MPLTDHAVPGGRAYPIRRRSTRLAVTAGSYAGTVTRRPPRRAVGPPGARPPYPEPRAPGPDPFPQTEPSTEAPDDDERLRADRPPHHDRGV